MVRNMNPTYHATKLYHNIWFSHDWMVMKRKYVTYYCVLIDQMARNTNHTPLYEYNFRLWQYGPQAAVVSSLPEEISNLGLVVSFFFAVYLLHLTGYGLCLLNISKSCAACHLHELIIQF